MTRFKELARIQSAIKYKNIPELQWAANYCRMRLGIATRKDHIKYWNRLEREVNAAMRTVDENSD